MFFKMSKFPIECCGTCQLTCFTAYQGLLLRFGQARKILVLNALLSNEDSGESPESAYNIVRVYEDSGT